MKKIILILFILALNNYIFGQAKMKITDRQIVKTKITNLPIDSAWSLWSTPKGLKTFFGSDNKIELQPGGAFEIYFLPDNPVGLKGSEGCKVLSFLPERFFSFSWNAPPQFKEVRNSDYKTWVVVQFYKYSETQTQIILTHLGWPEDTLWSPVFDYFTNAWDQVLNNLPKGDPPMALPTNKMVTGIGGVFFKCKDPKKLKEWYKTHLGLNTDQYGTNFEWREGADSSKKGFTQWSPFPETTKYFSPSTKEFMINYRVLDLEALAAKLKKDGVTITDPIESYEYGKFLHILDLEGNKIELWEPNDLEYDKIVTGRTK
jgi:uncharacterized protein YndB with AHSA1/START domain/predicted enzyme related to lactoylglutathione lyase